MYRCPTCDSPLMQSSPQHASCPNCLTGKLYPALPDDVRQFNHATLLDVPTAAVDVADRSLYQIAGLRYRRVRKFTRHIEGRESLRCDDDQVVALFDGDVVLFERYKA